MLSTGEMTRKIVFIYAHVTTDVALEGMVETMAAHVDGIEYIIRKVNITVLTFLQELLVHYSRGRGGCARLAVADAPGERVRVVLQAEGWNWTAACVS